LPATGATLPLKEGCGTVWCFVLEYGTHFGIVKSNFECGGGDDDVRIRVNSNILRTRSPNPNTASRCETMANVFHKRPVLTKIKSFPSIRKCCAPNISE
jgi:hypothetical protein